jgi:hypothetical protein
MNKIVILKYDINRNAPLAKLRVQTNNNMKK